VIGYVRRAVNESVTNDFSRLRERWRDPLLTVLTLLLALLMFVLAPLQAVGITGAQVVGHRRKHCSVGKSNRDRRDVGSGRSRSYGSCASPTTAFRSRCLSRGERLDLDGLGADLGGRPSCVRPRLCHLPSRHRCDFALSCHRLDIWGTFCSERSQPRLPSRRQARAVSVCRQGNGGPS
jgi:hypothetical protein